MANNHIEKCSELSIKVKKTEEEIKQSIQFTDNKLNPHVSKIMLNSDEVNNELKNKQKNQSNIFINISDSLKKYQTNVDALKNTLNAWEHEFYTSCKNNRITDQDAFDKEYKSLIYYSKYYNQIYDNLHRYKIRISRYINRDDWITKTLFNINEIFFDTLTRIALYYVLVGIATITISKYIFSTSTNTHFLYICLPILHLVAGISIWYYATNIQNIRIKGHRLGRIIILSILSVPLAYWSFSYFPFISSINSNGMLCIELILFLLFVWLQIHFFSNVPMDTLETYPFNKKFHAHKFFNCSAHVSYLKATWLILCVGGIGVGSLFLAQNKLITAYMDWNTYAVLAIIFAFNIYYLCLIQLFNTKVIAITFEDRIHQTFFPYVIAFLYFICFLYAKTLLPFFWLPVVCGVAIVGYLLYTNYSLNRNSSDCTRILNTIISHTLTKISKSFIGQNKSITVHVSEANELWTTIWPIHYYVSTIFLFIALIVMPENMLIKISVYVLFIFISFFLSFKRSQNKSNYKENNWLPIITFILLYACIILFASKPSLLGSSASPATIYLLLGCIFWVGIACIIHSIQKDYKIPIVPLCLFLILCGSKERNNHPVRHIPHSASHSNKLYRDASLWDFYTHWSQVNKIHKDTGTLYIVSAEGGGMRSASWVSLVLASMQKNDPSFKDHLFAISSVSGGTVGSNVFAACINKTPNSEQIEQWIDIFNKHDFLSAIIKQTVSLEIIQRFIPENLPFNLSVSNSRDLALEQQLSSAFYKATKDSVFYHGMLQANRSSQTYVQPALFINTTVVETGERAILSTVKLDTSVFNAIDIFDTIDYDIPWNSAISLSARFPGVSPAGRLYHDISDTSSIIGHLADGGYYDNSGTITAMEIAKALINDYKHFNPDGNITSFTSRIKFIVIRNQTIDTITPLLTLNEIREAPTTFFMARTAHSNDAVKTLKKEFNTQVIEINCDLPTSTVPIGWYLSPAALACVKEKVLMNYEVDMKDKRHFKSMLAH